MKSRRILITVFCTLLLTSCVAKADEGGFIENVETTTRVFTIGTNTHKTEAISEDPWEEEDDGYYEEEEYTTKKDFTEPKTIVPSQTFTRTRKTTETTTASTTVKTIQPPTTTKVTGSSFQKYVSSTTKKTTTSETNGNAISRRTSASATTAVTTTGTTMGTTSTSTTGTTTASTTALTTASTTIVDEPKGGIRKLPDSIQATVVYWRQVYTGMDIGVGIYSLDGLSGYEYNANQRINSACTVKLPYSQYVFQTCEQKGINVWTETITYEPRHKDSGTSVISEYGEYNTEYSIARLIELLLGESDNTAYSMLLDRFPLSGMYEITSTIGGQDDRQKWGRASVNQRKNEFLYIYRYINTGTEYANLLRSYLQNTKYCYLVNGMSNWHMYLHKSGWTDDTIDYPACNDVAIIDDSYMIVVMSQDYSTGVGHYDAISGIGSAIENYYYSNGGYIF